MLKVWAQEVCTERKTWQACTHLSFCFCPSLLEHRNRYNCLGPAFLCLIRLMHCVVLVQLHKNIPPHLSKTNESAIHLLHIIIFEKWMNYPLGNNCHSERLKKRALSLITSYKKKETDTINQDYLSLASSMIRSEPEWALLPGQRPWLPRGK